MPTTYKILGQSNPAANTNATLYTVPTSTSAVVSTIAVCNYASSSATYRISVSASATPANTEWLVYDATLPANDTVTLTLGITAQAARLIVVRASSASVTFSAFGSEIT